MEGMALWKTGFGGGSGLTPNLDALAGESLVFTDFYASGNTTYKGIYSLVFGYPTIYARHPFRSAEYRQPAGGLGHELHRRGYRTIFLCPHDEQFDNLGGYLKNNGFETVVAQGDFPRELIHTTLGVSDDDLFQQTIPRLNALHASGAPFLALYLTASDHSPFYTPRGPGFRPRSLGDKGKLVEYADWAIGRFMEAARREPWYRNTVFVFVSDHGTLRDPAWDLDLSVYRSPLLIHIPGRTGERVDLPRLGVQLDVFPTIMGILGFPWTNNTFGIDLVRETRPYAFFSSDDAVGVVDDEFFLISRRTGRASLHRHRDRSADNILGRFPDRGRAMERYAHAALQTAQVMVRRRLLDPASSTEEAAVTP
jgi:phosphoglycerol transferase MdoB-like AlkP superfamily enzyme